MTLLAWIAAVIFVGIPWAGLLYVLVYEPIRRYLRYRHARAVALSPILTHGDLTRRQARRALKRAGYVEMDTPIGKHRIGLN